MDHYFRLCVFSAILLLGQEGRSQTPWRNAFGAFGQDEASSVGFTAGGDIVAAGSTGSFGNGSSDAYLLRVSGLGELIWSRTIGGPQIDHAESLAILSDGSLMLAGYSNSGGAGGYDGWLVKTDPEGAVLWQRFYGGSGWDFFYDLDTTADGGFLISGATYSSGAGASDGWLLRTDQQGEEVWSRTFGDTGDDELRAACATADGGVVVAGSQWSLATQRDVLVSKLNGAGGSEWTYVYSTDSLEFASDVIQTLDGGYSIVGTTHDYEPFNEHLHLKLNANGDSLWSNHWGQVNDQEASAEVEVSSGDIYTVGYTETSGGGAKDMFILQTTAYGEFVIQRTFGGSEDDLATSVAIAPDGFIIAGRTNSFGFGGDDVLIVRTDSVCGPLFQVFGEVFDPVQVPEIADGSTFKLFPNPATTSCHLPSSDRLRNALLLDPQGRAVRTWNDPIPSDLDLTGLADGCYRILTIDENGGRSSLPLVIHAR